MMLERFLILWLSLISLLAFFWDERVVADPFTASAPYLNYLFAVAMFSIGWLLPRDEVQQVLGRWPMVAAGTALQYTSMPLLAYVAARVFRLEDDALLGTILVGAVPGAMASNVLTMVARGNVSYSVSLTTVATLCSPVFVPLALALTLGRRVEFPTLQVSWSLCWMVVVPVLAGHLLGRRFVAWQCVARKVGSSIANLTILWIIAVVIAINRERLIQFESALVAALLSVNLAGYAAGYAGACLFRLARPMRRALTIEIGTQNAGLGTVLALQLFPLRDAVSIPPALYTFGCMLTGTVLACAWAWLDDRASANDAARAG
jgi:BASS family bile acid:Na+ symporter